MWRCHNLSVTHTNWPSNTMFSLLITLHTSRLSWLAINNLLSSSLGDHSVKKLLYLLFSSKRELSLRDAKVPDLVSSRFCIPFEILFQRSTSQANGVNMNDFQNILFFFFSRPVHLCRLWKCSRGHHSGQDYGRGWRHWHQCQNDLQSGGWPGGKLHFYHQNRPSDAGGSGSACQGKYIYSVYLYVSYMNFVYI